MLYMSLSVSISRLPALFYNTVGKQVPGLSELPTFLALHYQRPTSNFQRSTPFPPNGL